MVQGVAAAGLAADLDDFRRFVHFARPYQYGGGEWLTCGQKERVRRAGQSYGRLKQVCEV